MKEFENSSETCKFLRVFNKAFDLLDSKSTGDCNKPPMKIDNKETWSKHFDEIEKYINSIHMVDQLQTEVEPNKKKKKMIDSKATSGSRKRGFLAFLINICSYREIFHIYVEKRSFLSYILGHKFSQGRYCIN